MTQSNALNEIQTVPWIPFHLTSIVLLFFFWLSEIVVYDRDTFCQYVHVWLKYSEVCAKRVELSFWKGCIPTPLANEIISELQNICLKLLWGLPHAKKQSHTFRRIPVQGYPLHNIHNLQGRRIYQNTSHLKYIWHLG